MARPVLVVMAAGMGSRYGGLKQIDPVGSRGEAILDYSIFDAYKAGFRTAVVIIKEAIREDFMQTVGKRLEKSPMEIRYVCQELHMLPEGYTVPEGRTKPWGTSHAVLCAKEAIGDAPCAVINADDYYGAAAFQVIYDFLSTVDGTARDYCMVGYELGKTVTDHGSVSRGICVTDDRDYLTDVKERTRIEKYPGGIHFTVDGGETWTDVDAQSTVSMNFWGYTESFIRLIEERFPAFLEKTYRDNPMKGEFYLPVLVGELLEEKQITVKVLRTPDRWYGVTYAADKPAVVAALREMTAAGKYPEGLWD